MRLLFTSFAAFPVVASLAGCGTACGPMQTVPAQRLAIVAASPAHYSIRVQPDGDKPIDTPVMSDGRVAFEVPVTTRDSRLFILGLTVYHYPPPDTARVIRVMRGEKTVRKLSAREIGSLPLDSAGYHVLSLEK